MLHLLAQADAAVPIAAPTGNLLTDYGPLGVFGVVILAVLTALYRMNEKSRDNDASRIRDQLNSIERIAAIQQETVKAQAAAAATLSVITAKMDDLVRDLREMVKERS